MRVDYRARSGGIIRIFKMKVCCVYSLESPPRGTQHTIINIKRKSPETSQIEKMSAAMVSFLLGIQEQVRNSCG